VQDVFTTAWGDNGADAGLFSLLPVFQLQAELGFHKDVSLERLSKRFKTCTGADLSDFMLLDMPDISYEKKDGFLHPHENPHKYLLFQDVLMGLFDRHVPKGTAEKYRELAETLHTYTRQEMPCSYLFETAQALFSVLALKAELGIRLKAAYDNGNRTFLQEAVSSILPSVIERTEYFRECVEKQWMKENKPFGFEVQDIRIGGLLQRLKTAQRRIEAYISGAVETLPELEEVRLPIADLQSDEFTFFNNWRHTVSASLL